MDPIPDLHDAAIVGITYDSAAKELALGLEIDGKRASLLFGDTFGWIFSPFEDQNVIFEVNVHEPLSGRVKSGHTWTGQNRPTGDRVETVRFYPAAS